MGFCTDEQYRRFLRQAPVFERMLIEDGILLRKYWFSVSDREQEKRFRSRQRDPLRRWKLSDMDVLSITRWEDYSRAKDEMFAATDTVDSPWYNVDSEDKKRSRLNVIAHLLGSLPYDRVSPPEGEDPGPAGGARLPAPAAEPAAVRARPRPDPAVSTVVVAPGTGWPGDRATPETPVATDAADVVRLAATALSIEDVDARSSVCRACPRLVDLAGDDRRRQTPRVRRTRPTGAGRFPASETPHPGCSSSVWRRPHTAPTAPDATSPVTAPGDFLVRGAVPGRGRQPADECRRRRRPAADRGAHRRRRCAAHRRPTSRRRRNGRPAGRG